MNECAMMPFLSRRLLLGGAAAAMVAGRSVRGGARAATNADARLVVINIPGGLDGLATVIPYGDPSLAGLRASLVPSKMVKIDPFFALHPAMPNFTAMFKNGEAGVIHCVGPTVATRSHFLGQDYLQAGTGTLLSSGWLNRATALSAAPAGGLSFGPEAPLLMRGPVVPGGYAPAPYAQTSPALAPLLHQLMAQDPLLSAAQSAAFADRAIYNSILGTTAPTSKGDLPSLARVAGSLMASPIGPRIVSLETASVDTHDAQAARIGPMLAELDSTIAALKSSLGAAWARTVVVTMTEFGRTAYENGTQGTDHGTAFAVLLAGGAVAGGKVTVVTRWPGMTSGDLYGGRDLAPTVDFRQIAMGLLIDHMGVPAASQPTIFPASDGLTPMSGLVTG